MKKGALISFIITSVLITMFLFYIDEGYYNFKWMAHWGNWAAFLVYVVPIFSAQLLIYRLIPEKFLGKGGIVLSALLGITAGIFFVVKVVFWYIG